MKVFEPKPRKPRYNFRPHDSSRARMRRLRQIARGLVRAPGVFSVDAATKLLEMRKQER